MHRPPQLAVDRFGEVAIVHTSSARAVAEWLPKVRPTVEPMCPTAYVKVHPPTPRDYVADDEPAWGPPCEEVIVTERGVRYIVRPTSGLTVGLFLDMREVRQWLRKVSRDKTVLNLFAYTCSFGVCASLGGASRVVNLDLSRSYLEWGKANYAANGLSVEPRDFVYGDALDWLQRFARHGLTFDVVIVDPPSFSSTPFSVTRDYARLVASAARVVAPSGLLLAATNHAQTSGARFEGWLREGLEAADRSGRVLRRWHEPAADFPVPRGQRPYLKVRALQLT